MRNTFDIGMPRRLGRGGGDTMLALAVFVVLLASMVVAWRRFDLGRSRIGRVVLVAVGGGFGGAFALFAAFWLQPLGNAAPFWLTAASDALLLFPLIMLTHSTSIVVLSWLAPMLLGIELSVVFLCVMLVVRLALRVSGNRDALHTRQ
jgi:hypothetical protein